MRPGSLALAAAALILFIYAPVLLTPGQLLTSGDGMRFFFPAFLWQRANLAALPLWTEALGGGFPLVAESQMAAFYPLQWPFLFLSDPVWGYNLYQLTHLLLGCCTAAYLFAALRAAPLPAALGALAFALGGRVTALLDHPNQPVVIAWLPLLYAFALRAVRDRDRRAAYYGAIVVALMLLAGHSQVVLIALLGLVPFVLFFAPPGQRLQRAAAVLLIMLAAGFALAGIQLVPFAELFTQSVRAGGLSYASADSTNMSLWNLLLLAAPFLFGDSGNINACWLAGRHLSELQLYCGMLPLLAALATLTDRTARRNPVVRFWWGFALLFFLPAMGGRTPIGPLLHQLPVLSALLNPSRFVLPCQLALAALAVIGMGTLLARPRAVMAPALLLAAVLLAAGLAVSRFPSATAAALQPDTLLTVPELLAAMPRLVTELRDAAAWLAVALAALWFARGAVRRGQPRFAAGIILLAVACDLSAFTRRLLQPDSAAPFFRPPPSARRLYHLPGAGSARVANMLLPAGVEDFSLYTNLGLHLGNRFRPLLDQPLPAALALARIDELHMAVLPRWRDCPYAAFDPLAIISDTPYSEALHLPAGGGARRLQVVLAATYAAGADTVGLLTVADAAGRVLAARPLRAGLELGQLRESAPDELPAPIARIKSETNFYIRYYAQELPLARGSDTIIVSCSAQEKGSAIILAGLALVGNGTVDYRHYPRLPDFARTGNDDPVRPATVLPKLLAPRRWQAVAPQAQAAALRDPEFAPADIACVAGAAGSRIRPLAVTVHTDRPEYHAFTTAGDEPGFIVRLVAWYSAWECRIDGQPVPVQIADVMFQGVPVPAGTHRVEFIFSRTALYLGLLNTLLGAVLIGAGLFFARFSAGSAGSKSSTARR